MKLFDNHSGSKDLPHFTKGIYWKASLLLRAPFPEECAELVRKPHPPDVSQVAFLAPLNAFQTGVVRIAHTADVDLSRAPYVLYGVK